MGLRWTESGEIAGAPIAAPADPPDHDVVDLPHMISALAGFDDDPGDADEARLEAVVVAWNDRR